MRVMAPSIYIQCTVHFEFYGYLDHCCDECECKMTPSLQHYNKLQPPFAMLNAVYGWSQAAAPSLVRCSIN